MGEFTINSEKVAEIIRKSFRWSSAFSVITVDPDAVADEIIDVMDFLHDLFNAEADALKESEPYATRTIAEYEHLAFQLSTNAYEVGELLREVKL